jgi:hypothetical protein
MQVTPERRLPRLLALLIAGSAAILGGVAVRGETASTGSQVVIPPSSVEHPGDIGSRAHTHLEILVPPAGSGPLHPPSPSGSAEPSGGAPSAPSSAGAPMGLPAPGNSTRP